MTTKDSSGSDKLQWMLTNKVARMQDQMDNVKDKLKVVEEKVSLPHTCIQGGVFEAFQTMIASTKSDVDSNATSIKKLYTWQATVGISLLVFFLTIGVAALRYVDKIDFAVEKNKDNIARIEKKLQEDESSSLSKEDLRKILDEALKKDSP